jgi:hypothetical protein
VPIEPALLAKRRHGCRERASIERAEGRMPAVSVRRDGTGPPRSLHETTPAQRPAVQGFKYRELVGGERGLGELVVSGLRESGPGSPNGPPSHRLAPGGFYAFLARNAGLRGAGPCQSSGVAGEAKAGCRERASIERAEGMDAQSERPARWHGPAPKLARGEPRPTGRRPAGSSTRVWLVVIADRAGWW